jgi:hypothetical protein
MLPAIVRSEVLATIVDESSNTSGWLSALT